MKTLAPSADVATPTSSSVHVRLVDHRVLELSHDRVAAIATSSNGWAITTKTDYELLKAALLTPRPLSNLDTEEHALVERLWNRGMVAIDGRPHPVLQDAAARASEVPSSLLLKLTGACNIACTYCYDYSSSRWHSKLTVDQIEPTIRWLLENRDTLAVVFHGGEPLLEFKLITDIVARIRGLARPHQSVTFSVQTNATLLTAEKVQFLKEHKFAVGVSIDGRGDVPNLLRKTHNKRSTWHYVEQLFAKFPAFARECGYLAVVSQTSAPGLIDFALWLQHEGVSGLTLSFHDKEGRGAKSTDQHLGPDEIVEVYRRFIQEIYAGRLKIRVKPLTSYIGNVHNLVSKSFCHKGPCGAAAEFLVLDATGAYRTCDCAYDPFFEVGADVIHPSALLPRLRMAQDRVRNRHYELGSSENYECKSCSLFGVCGGTCVAKAISNTGTALARDPGECATAKFLYPLVFEELAQGTRGGLVDYYISYDKHR